MGDLLSALHISEMGMSAQAQRIKVVSQNLANQFTTGATPGSLPYRRKMIHFKAVMDEEMNSSSSESVPSNSERVEVARFADDYKTPFVYKYEPAHPAANEEGYVLYPNINYVLEIADAKEAEIAYQANMSMLSMTRKSLLRTIDLLSK